MLQHHRSNTKHAPLRDGKLPPSRWCAAFQLLVTFLIGEDYLRDNEFIISLSATWGSSAVLSVIFSQGGDCGVTGSLVEAIVKCNNPGRYVEVFCPSM